MKTNQVLTRKMGSFDVLQRTSDGMFNATALLKQWNVNNKKKDIDDFLNNKSTKEYINVIISKENLNTHNSGDLKIIKSNRGKNGGTWMHPFLFIDFAMWLNAEFKYEVIKFVYDELIKYRNEAGTAYKDMTRSIAKIVPKNELPKAIPNVARAINYVIYNNHESQLMNKQANELLLRERYELEKDISKLIDFGFVVNLDDLILHLRKRWVDKWQPKCLA